MKQYSEQFVSVDIEASGPIPGEYSMLSIGACLVFEPSIKFYCELKPISTNVIEDAISISNLSMKELTISGCEPVYAMERFEEWLLNKTSNNQPLIFVGFNAPFDWSFVNYYFHRYLGRNPFGFSALDVKAYFMGKFGCNWKDTKSSNINKQLNVLESGNHNALNDAIYQAKIFRLILNDNFEPFS